MCFSCLLCQQGFAKEDALNACHYEALAGRKIAKSESVRLGRRRRQSTTTITPPSGNNQDIHHSLHDFTTTRPRYYQHYHDRARFQGRKSGRQQAATPHSFAAQRTQPPPLAFAFLHERVCNEGLELAILHNITRYPVSSLLWPKSTGLSLYKLQPILSSTLQIRKGHSQSSVSRLTPPAAL